MGLFREIFFRSARSPGSDRVGLFLGFPRRGFGCRACRGTAWGCFAKFLFCRGRRLHGVVSRNFSAPLPTPLHEGCSSDFFVRAPLRRGDPHGRPIEVLPRRRVPASPIPRPSTDAHIAALDLTAEPVETY